MFKNRKSCNPGNHVFRFVYTYYDKYISYVIKDFYIGEVLKKDKQTNSPGKQLWMGINNSVNILGSKYIWW